MSIMQIPSLCRPVRLTNWLISHCTLALASAPPLHLFAPIIHHGKQKSVHLGRENERGEGLLRKRKQYQYLPVGDTLHIPWRTPSSQSSRDSSSDGRRASPNLQHCSRSPPCSKPPTLFPIPPCSFAMMSCTNDSKPSLPPQTHTRLVEFCRLPWPSSSK